MHYLHSHLLLLILVLTADASPSTEVNTMLPSDAVSLLSFKSKADLDNKLLYALNERYDYCEWQGVKCAQGRVVRFVVQGFSLRGTFAADTLARLDQLRVLSLRNNSLSGTIPDLSPLKNLKSLFLDRNRFSGTFPLSVLTLHRLVTLSLAHNELAGPIPVRLNSLDRLISLRLDSNYFNGTLPALNLSFLETLDVSNNNLTGPVPVTPTLAKFDAPSFSGNNDLCGEIIHKPCDRHSRFFGGGGSSAATSSGAPLGQSEQGIVVVHSPIKERKHKSSGLVLGISVAAAVLVGAGLAAVAVARKKNRNKQGGMLGEKFETEKTTALEVETGRNNPAQLVRERENENDVLSTMKVKRIEEIERAHKSGKLIFCYGEAQPYTLEQLMRASAELLGRGSVGTTYKAVLDSRLILTVKRMDAGKTAAMSGEVFERHMEMVGALRHPNLVPVRAYFQSKGERLVIYDYQPNGSLFNLVHGSRSARAKPLHWTSCLKIAEDVVHGLAYVHQASSLIHGNLKSSNVLLGPDFEACITDYGLSFLADSSVAEDADSTAYKAPEVRQSSRRASSKSDVYSFGVLLLELLTGKHPSQHPVLVPTDLQDWVRAMRDDDDSEDNRLEMLTEVASICSATSPEQRPAMWQVLKMIQEIKESAT
ncbi:hypothetical protein HN51_001020 [Arachis hypogaea]|uniref:Protein kinase domain-containing protein n=1 Tax=Arachis hypogaea TaxID=3818 RepID=A0A445ETV5_ARAHY|nr:probable inactive receptor kinase At5g67200 [Arachis hypogaea]QHO49051.1 putative inactive receptor kinase [Arachis hypogaea]RYR78757.1 hypothetical protein Ahy_A01g003616 [Arachis hypogaea]